jgi:hypothetical protein
MSQEVFVNKTGLFNLLGPATMRFAMFMAGGTQEGTAMRILMDNVESIDMNCDLVQLQLIPMLSQVGVLDNDDLVRIQAYINNALGIV